MKQRSQNIGPQTLRQRRMEITWIDTSNRSV